MGWPVFEMDHMALDIVAEHGLDLGLITATELRAIREADACVSDGSYLGWAEPVLDDADLIIYLNPSARSALFRILLRHACKKGLRFYAVTLAPVRITFGGRDSEQRNVI